MGENVRDNANAAFDELDEEIARDKPAPKIAPKPADAVAAVVHSGDANLSRVANLMALSEPQQTPPTIPPISQQPTLEGRMERRGGSRPSDDLWPTVDRKVKISGKAVDTFQDFEKLGIDEQATYIERLPSGGQNDFISLIEDSRAGIIKDYLALSDPFDKLDFWTKFNSDVRSGKTTLPTNIWK